MIDEKTLEQCSAATMAAEYLEDVVRTILKAVTVEGATTASIFATTAAASKIHNLSEYFRAEARGQ